MDMTVRTNNMTSSCNGVRTMREPTIAAGYVRGLLQLAALKGASQQVLAERSQIDPEELQDQDNRIPLAKYVVLMRVAKELCKDPALALHFGEAFDFAEMSIVGLIARASETGAEALVQVNRYARLVAEVDFGTADRYRLERKGNELWLVDSRSNPNTFPELTESAFARAVCMARRYATERQFIKAVHVTHAEPAYRAEYDRIFQVPVVFDSDKNALVSTPEWLTYRTSHSSRYVFGILSAKAEELLKMLESSKSTRGRVENLLLPVLHTGNANIETIARKLALSRQTLFRRLKAEGTTFEKLLDELRHKMALHYLRGRNVSVNETAYLVGFSEPAAFSRAFKRWTGSSPRPVRSKESQ
jgi:AraC-like DNA-binding protein